MVCITKSLKNKYNNKVKSQKNLGGGSPAVNKISVRGKIGNSVKFYFPGLPESLCMVTTIMKLKDAYSLEVKLRQT